DGFIYPEYAVCGFVWAGLRHMDVTNSSYYVDPFMYWCEDQPDQRAAKEAVRRAVEFSTARGVVHAAAAGNAAADLATNTTDTSSPNDSTPVQRVINSGCEDIPAELDGVVTVSSVTQTGELSSFSNRGLGKIDVAAPGSSILSTTLDGTWGLKSGTSMASPHVAGVLALLKSAHPRWSPARLEAAVRAQADDHERTTASGPVCVGTPADNGYYGDREVHALAAWTRRPPAQRGRPSASEPLADGRAPHVGALHALAVLGGDEQPRAPHLQRPAQRPCQRLGVGRGEVVVVAVDQDVPDHALAEH